MGLRKGVLYEIDEKLTSEHIIFERMDVFFTKYRLGSSVFLREWTFFTNMGMRVVIFSLKIGKNCILFTFFVHNIGSFVRIDVFVLIKYGHGSRWFILKS